MYNAKKEYDSAFLYYSNGNSSKASSSTFDITKYRTAFQKFSSVFTKEFVSKSRSVGNASTVPAFIVGMPRSGTTLTEQIIISHSNVYSRGETTNIGNLIENILTKNIQNENGSKNVYYPETIKYCSGNEIKELANKYLNTIQNGKDGALKIFDKMPLNSFNVGFIKTIFPNATIINCKRHPLDIVVSIFCSNFIESDFPNTIEIVAEYYKYYNVIMKHWHSIFPGEIYDNYYEELVYRQPYKSHELIKACGLDWEDSCLDFYKNKKPVFTASHSQVKEPIYSSSIFRWKNYDAHLGSVKEILKNEIAEYESEVISRVPELAEKL